MGVCWLVAAINRYRFQLRSARLYLDHDSDNLSILHRLFADEQGLSIFEHRTSYIISGPWRCKPLSGVDVQEPLPAAKFSGLLSATLEIPPLGQDKEREQNTGASSFNNDVAHIARVNRAVGNNSNNILQQGLDGGPPLVRMGNEAELEFWLWDNESIIDMLR